MLHRTVYLNIQLGSIMPSKQRVNFKQYIPKKHEKCGIKMYKLCDMTGYTYNKRIYLGNQMQKETQMMTATHVSEKSGKMGRSGRS